MEPRYWSFILPPKSRLTSGQILNVNINSSTLILPSGLSDYVAVAVWSLIYPTVYVRKPIQFIPKRLPTARASQDPFCPLNPAIPNIPLWSILVPTSLRC